MLCFCDASAKAYAACLYIRCIKDGVVTTNLVFSQLHISSKEKMTIPKLELLAGLVGVRSMNYVKRHWKFKIKKEILWTGSSTVLYWIKSSKYQGVFVKNRIDEIRKKEGVNFRYILTNDNPADLATRGNKLVKYGITPHGGMDQNGLKLFNVQWKCNISYILTE